MNMDGLRLIQKKPYLKIIIILLASLANWFLNWICEVLSLPFFGDSAMTIAAAVFLGIPSGVSVAVLTNLLIDIFHGVIGDSLPFALVGILTAVFMGIMAGKNRLLKPLNVFWSIIWLVLLNAAAGTIVLSIFGTTTNASRIDSITGLFFMGGFGEFTAAFVSRLPMNLVDKGIPVLIIYPIYRYVYFKKTDVVL